MLAKGIMKIRINLYVFVFVMNFISLRVVKSKVLVKEVIFYGIHKVNLLSFNSFCRHGIFWIIKSMFLFSVIIWRDYFRLHTLRHWLPHLFCSLPDPGHMVAHLHHRKWLLISSVAPRKEIPLLSLVVGGYTLPITLFPSYTLTNLQFHNLLSYSNFTIWLHTYTLTNTLLTM